MVHSPPSKVRPLHNTCITASTHQVLWSTPLPARPDLSTTPVSPPPLTKSCGPLPSQPGQTSPQHLYHHLHSPSLVVHSPPSQARPLHNTCITASTHQVLWSTPLPARPDLSTTPVSLPPLTKSCGPLPSQPGQTSPQHLYHCLHSPSLVVHSPPSQARPLNKHPPLSHFLYVPCYIDFTQVSFHFIHLLTSGLLLYISFTQTTTTRLSFFACLISSLMQSF